MGEVCFGIEVAVVEGYRVGDWSWNWDVMIVEAEDLFAGLAVGMRAVGLPIPISIRSALVYKRREK